MDKRKKIFIVEDESIIALTLESTLENLGFNASGIASNAIQCMQYLKESVPDLILMDIHLDGNIDGIELAKKINTLYSIPIIFLTAYSGAELVEKAKDAYPYGYIIKPFRTNDLQITITLALNKWEYERKLSVSENKYRNLVETIHEGIYQFHLQDFSTQFINSSFCEMMDISYEEVMDKKHSGFLSAVSSQIVKEPEDKYELKIITPKGSEKYFYISTGTILNESGEIHSSLSIWRDITNRKKEALQLTKFYNTIEQSEELILITDKAGKIEYANPTFYKVTGYLKEELISQTPRIMKSGRHTPAFYTRLWKNLLNGKTVTLEFVNKKKNGEIYYEEKIISPLVDESGKITNFISTGRDITEKKMSIKKIEALKKFQKISEIRQNQIRSESMIQGQEEERKRIARDLHDGIGQILTAAKVNLEMPNISRLQQDKKYKQIEQVYLLVNETIHEVRKISHNLSPSILKDFGLFSAVRGEISRINSQNGKLKIEFETNLTAERFKSSIEINVYRIIQEAINNAIKHSKCTLIKIKLVLQKELLNVSVSDNGIGFNFPDDSIYTESEQSKIGLKNIKERGYILGIPLKINAQQGKGVRIEFTVNLKIKHDKDIVG